MRDTAGSAAALAAENFAGKFHFEPPSSFTSLDHLVGARFQRLRNDQVESLGCLHVDDKLEAGRLLNREIGWLCTSQDTIDVGCGLPEQVDIVDPVAQKAALRDVIPIRIDRWQPETLSERDDLGAMAGKKGVRNHYDTAA